MDTLNHSVQGFILGYVVTGNIPISVVSGVISTIPDLYGEYRAYKDGHYLWYNKVHTFKHWLSFIPPITLHIALDKLGHDEGERWYAGKFWEYFLPCKWRERMWLESITWLINILLILKLFIL